MEWLQRRLLLEKRVLWHCNERLDELPDLRQKHMRRRVSACLDRVADLRCRVVGLRLGVEVVSDKAWMI